jgi:hypothetical protein
MSNTLIMSSEKQTHDISSFLVYAVILLLSVLLTLSFFPQFSLKIETPQLILASIIVALLLFRYFNVIEIPGFLKLNKQIQEVKEEAKEIRQIQMNLAQTFALSQNMSNKVYVNPVINGIIKDEGEEAENLLSQPSPTSAADMNISFEIVKNETDRILEHANRHEYSAAFLDIRRCIESLFKDILGTRGSEPLGILQQLREAQKREIIGPSLYESMNTVRRVANIFIHMPISTEADVNFDEVSKTIQLGIRVIAELQSIKRQKEFKNTRQR